MLVMLGLEKRPLVLSVAPINYTKEADFLEKFWYYCFV